MINHFLFLYAIVIKIHNSQYEISQVHTHMNHSQINQVEALHFKSTKKRIRTS